MVWNGNGGTRFGVVDVVEGVAWLRACCGKENGSTVKD